MKNYNGQKNTNKTLLLLIVSTLMCGLFYGFIDAIAASEGQTFWEHITGETSKSRLSRTSTYMSHM